MPTLGAGGRVDGVGILEGGEIQGAANLTRPLSNITFSGNAYEQSCRRPATFLGVISESPEKRVDE